MILLIATIYLGSTLLLIAMMKVAKKYDPSIFEHTIFDTWRLLEIAAYVPVFNTLSVLYLLPETIDILREARLTFEDEPEWDNMEWVEYRNHFAAQSEEPTGFIEGAEWARKYFDGEIDTEETA